MPFDAEGNWTEPTGPNRIAICHTPDCWNEGLEIEVGPGDDQVICGVCNQFMEQRPKGEGEVITPPPPPEDDLPPEVPVIQPPGQEAEGKAAETDLEVELPPELIDTSEDAPPIQ